MRQNKSYFKVWTSLAVIQGMLGTVEGFGLTHTVALQFKTLVCAKAKLITAIKVKVQIMTG